MANFEKGQKVYVSSSDSRQNGFDATITSIGSKFISVVVEYGTKHRFSKDTLVCEEWAIYQLEESRESYENRLARDNKLSMIGRNYRLLGKVLSDEELDDIYKRIKNIAKY